MKKSYITSMPDHIGAFLKASELFAELGINITRVSYNKAIDSNTLFIDAEGTAEQLTEAEKKLEQIGYLQIDKNENSIVLLEFCLRDIPGSVTDVLELISKFNFNISYISSQENGSEYQLFKMGLFVDDMDKINSFLRRAEKICKVKVIDYNHSEKVYDNSIFYNSFVDGLLDTIELSNEERNRLLINTNLAMQILDEQGLSPYKTFENIRKFAELISKYRGDSFSPRITHHYVGENTEIILIEPQCGSNTTIVKSNGDVLFIDSGYSIYHNEMEKLFKRLIPEFDTMEKKILVTHADLDHCGLLPMFDEIISSKKTKECLSLEFEGKEGFREQNLLHKPYIEMCKALTMYQPVESKKVKGLWERTAEEGEALERVGEFVFGELEFEVYEGKGGHLLGEIVLIDYKHNIAFTGDIFINMSGLTPEQAEYNKYAPILMTSVDTKQELCARERKELFNLLSKGEWQIFGGHGSKKQICIE